MLFIVELLGKLVVINLGFGGNSLEISGNRMWGVFVCVVIVVVFGVWCVVVGGVEGVGVLYLLGVFCGGFWFFEWMFSRFEEGRFVRSLGFIT